MQFKESLTKQDIQLVFDRLGELREPIPQIKSYKYGKYDSNEGANQGFDYGFEMEFDNAADRDIYLHHPVHVALAGTIIPQLKDGLNSLLAFDYDPTKGL